MNTFSPKIEFEYVGALNRLDRSSEALQTAKDILNVRLEPNDRARALSQIAEIYIKLRQPSNAKPHLEECVGMNFESSWKALCGEQLKLID